MTDDDYTDLLDGSTAGVDLLDGTRVIGKIVRWDKYKVYIDIGVSDPIDIPRDIIKRFLLALKGGK